MINIKIMETLLTNKDVMSILSIKDKELMPRLRREGLPYLKIGGSFRYKREWIEEFIEKKSTKSLNK